MKREPLQNEGKKGDTMQTTTQAGDLLTIGELATRLKMHPVTVRGLWRRRSIPGLVIGHRTLRFEYGAVIDALRQAGDQAALQTVK
jgi:hypothetical protein